MLANDHNKNESNPFPEFIANFRFDFTYDDVFPDIFQDAKKKELAFLLKEEKPCLINIVPFFKDNEKDQLESYGEQGRKGGLGKTVLVTSCRNFVYKYKNEKNTEGSNPPSFPKIELIELDKQYNTKEDILKKIYSCLKAQDLTLAPSGSNAFLFADFVKNVLDEDKQAGFDPSYSAERYFSESCEKLIAYWQNDQTEKAKFYLFFDAFDAQYLGNEFSPFRKWLLDQLFPFLIKKLRVLLLVSGREEINLKKEFAIKKHNFVLDVFKEDLMLEYMRRYHTRLSKRLTDNQEQVKWQEEDWKKLVKTIKKDSSIKTYLLSCTDGKPIFIDYFCDVMWRKCNDDIPVKAIIQDIRSLEVKVDDEEEQRRTFQDILDLEVTVEDKEDLIKRITFKKYLVNELKRFEKPEFENVKEKQSIEKKTALTISLLTLARHGLTAEQFVDLESLGSYTDVIRDYYIGETDKFFRESFSQENYSYIKNRESEETSPKIIRLLHDEVVDLFLKYWYDDKDKKYEQRNRFIGQLMTMHDKRLKEIERLGTKDYSDEYARLLLEYIEYSLLYRGEKEEQCAINRLLYEFAYFLDRHPDLSSRILEKGNKYYTLKKKDWEESEEPNNNKIAPKTLTFSKDFSLLFKLRMREAEYCLTERSEGWQERINDVLKELNEITNPKSEFYTKHKNKSLRLPQLIPNELEGLQARRRSTEGEKKFWIGQWDEGREDVIKARELFYLTGDSLGVAWTELLLGFEAQRSGEFRRALQHHRNTIESMLQHARFLHDQIEKRRQTEEDTQLYGLYYRLHFVLKTINRANSNLSVNLRYRGKILEAIRILESNEELATLVGLRETVRTKSNLAVLFAIRGIDTQFSTDETLLNEQYLNEIIDPLLQRVSAIATTNIIKRKKVVSLRLIDWLKRREKNINDPLLPVRIIGAEITSLTKRLRGNLPFEFMPSRISKSAALVKAEDVKHIFILTKVGLKKPAPYLNISKQKDFILTTHINDENARILLRSTSREIGDLYYQYGKTVLITQQGNSETHDHYEEAQIAYENARFIARKSTFRYLEMETCEALYRLAFLIEQKHPKLATYRNDLSA